MIGSQGSGSGEGELHLRSRLHELPRLPSVSDDPFVQRGEVEPLASAIADSVKISYEGHAEWS